MWRHVVGPSRLLAVTRWRRSLASASVPVRVRFAPSPTGSLHLGGLRTALFNFLFARQSGGAFLVRIEDTDLERLVPGAADSLLHTLRQVGIVPDEGPEQGGPHAPYVQSERKDIYVQHARDLVQRGAAYRCFCTADVLAAKRIRQQEKGLPTLYDRTCLHLTPAQIEAKLAAGESHTLRLRVPAGETELTDAIYGVYRVANSTVDDQILLKSDGMPTYHLANVVDDRLMRISHVIRGAEWLPSTPKHVMLYRALGWAPPVFAHLPLLLTEDRKKLSKRHAAASVAGLLQDVLPSALVNYVAFLGWAPTNDMPGSAAQRMLLPDLARAFSLAGVNKAPAAVDVAKLRAVNASHVALACERADLFPALAATAVSRIKASLPASAAARLDADAAFAERLVRLTAPRVAVLSDFAREAEPLVCAPAASEACAALARVPGLAPASGRAVLQHLLGALMALPDCSAASTVGLLPRVAKAGAVPAKQAALASRAALTARDAGPPLPDVLALIGREDALARVQAALAAAQI